MPKVVTKLYSINIVCVIMHYTFKSDMPASANSLSSKAVLCQCFPLSALTTRSIAGIRRSEHITEAVASFHWLRARECIKFKLAVIVYRALHGTAPQYLSGQLQYVADLPSRPSRRRCYARRPPVSSVFARRDLLLSAIARLLLLAHYSGTAYLSLITFRQKPKTHLFRQSYPAIVF